VIRPFVAAVFGLERAREAYARAKGGGMRGKVVRLSAASHSGGGHRGGFTFVLEDRAGRDIPFLAGNVNEFMEAARKRRAV